jgi:hypothetical protein
MGSRIGRRHKIRQTYSGLIIRDNTRDGRARAALISVGVPVLTHFIVTVVVVQWLVLHIVRISVVNSGFEHIDR